MSKSMTIHTKHMGVIMLNIKIILIVDGKLILKPNMLNMNVGEVKQTVKILL